MTNWFTSDWHLFHANIIKYAKRPYENVEQMNDQILFEFNSTVERGDTLYFMGDFAFLRKENLKAIKSYLQHISSTVELHVVYGNHDNGQMRKLLSKYAISAGYMKRINLEFDDMTVTLCHFPMVSFHKSHWNNWQVYGHHHSITEHIIHGKRMNVTLEANNYHLVSEDQLREYMAHQEDNWDYMTKTGA